MGARFPDFIIVGAPRSGTTSLARYLGAHPQVSMVAQKEIRFFNDHYDNGIDWYQSHFSDVPAGTLCGEASPRYMSTPEALDRIRQHIPDVKLLVTLREPTARAWSGYLTRRERDLEPRDFRDIVASEIEIFEREGHLTPETPMLAVSLYVANYREMFSRFDRSQVSTAIFERMVVDPRETYQSFCSHLGIDESFTPDNLGRQINPYVEFRSLRLRSAARRFDPGLLSRAMQRANTRRGVRAPEIPSEAKGRLMEFFAPHIGELEQLLQIEIPEWKT